MRLRLQPWRIVRADLEHAIVTRRLYEEHPPRAEYVLTQKGRELGPALQALLVWGRKHTG
jgi:DNA-binding HxlR family transcriptional regulator